MIGKLHSDGSLTDIGNRTPQTYGDGSVDVALAAMPTTFGPWTYDAVGKVTVPAPKRVPRPIAAIAADIDALTPAQRQAALTQLLARHVQANPSAIPGVQGDQSG